MARALVVDDDALNRDVMTRMCERMGMGVSQAVDGQAALVELRREPADVVLLDLHMPEVDGFGVLEELRAHPVSPRPAVVIVTASADAAGRLRGTDLGAIDFVEKPFRLEDLERRVRRALSITELERRVAEAESALKALRRTDQATGFGSSAQLYGVLEAQFRCAELMARPLSCTLVSDEGYALTLARDGRPAGEQRLQSLARLIEGAVRPTDFVFRMDAAELVVLAPATSQAAAAEQARALVERVREERQVPVLDLAVAVASYPHPQIAQASSLYRAANVALAQARSREEERMVLFERF